jgi:peptidoglycan hydrolase CwlO-like protein
MSQQDIWDLWAAIEDIRTKAKAQDERIDKLTKSLRRLRADIKRARAQKCEGPDVDG